MRFIKITLFATHKLISFILFNISQPIYTIIKSLELYFIKNLIKLKFKNVFIKLKFADFFSFNHRLSIGDISLIVVCSKNVFLKFVLF